MSTSDSARRVVADRLAKSFHRAIMVAASGDDSLRSELRHSGLLDWVRIQHPDTTHPLEMAADAFRYLVRDHRHVARVVLTGLIAALSNEWDYNLVDPANDMRNLKAMLDSEPLDEDRLRDWFQQAFTPS